jgi:ribonucleoside-diphosphate reductase alpha chain
MGVDSEETPRVPASRVLSSGFVRKPNLASSNVVVMSPSAPSTTSPVSPVQALQMRAEALGSLALMEAPVIETHVQLETHLQAEPLAMTAANRRAEARMKGYEGDSCGECGNFTMVRNGTCLKCDSCGSTSGCS